MAPPDLRAASWGPHVRRGARTAAALGLSLLGALGAGLAHSAGTASLGIGAVVLSKNICKFQTATLDLPFGSINAASDIDATASATLTFKCAGADPMAAYSITQDGGLHKTSPGANRLRHATLNHYLPYSLSLTPASGTTLKNDVVTVTVQGLILSSHFQNAEAGAYADTVVLSITP